MHAAIELAVFWAFAFLTLCLAVILSGIYGNVIQSDMDLLTPDKEAVVAAIASLIEAAGIWLIVMFIPAMTRGYALRAEFIPILIVALLYKIAHLESWSVYDVMLLLLFQMAIGCFIASLLTGHFLAALMIVAVLGIVLALIANFARNFWD